jgi:hypothetical protein
MGAEELYMLWWQFLLWIALYSETKGYVGYYRETFRLHPTIVYFKNGSIYTHEIEQQPKGIVDGKLWDES